MGQVIRQRRIAKKLSQEELAERLGTTRQRVISWEKDRNHPNMRYQAGLCLQLGGKPSDYAGVMPPLPLEKVLPRLQRVEDRLGALEEAIATVIEQLLNADQLPS